MNIRALERSGLAFTSLGFGASQIGNLYRETTDGEAFSAVDQAWNGGVRYFDTAPHYGLGLSERRLGSALASRPRDGYVLSTKVGRILEPDPDGADRADDEGFAVPAAHRRHRDYSRAGVRRSIEESLSRLGTDRIDVAYVHDPDDHFRQTLDEAIPALIELRAEGVLSAVGVGMNHASMLARFVEQTDIDIVMVAGRLTLLDQSASEELLPLAAARGIGVIAAGVFNSGLLSRPRPAFDAKYDYDAAPPELVRRAHSIADVCEVFGVSLPEAAIAYPLTFPAVTSVVLGMRTGRQVDENLSIARRPIPKQLWMELAERGFIPAATVESTPAISQIEGHQL